MKLTLTDLNFWWNQINLPNNTPAFPTDPTGLRDVSGAGNNVFNPSWGNTNQLFPRLTAAQWRNAQGTLDATFQPVLTPTSYATRGVNLIDGQPRNISNWVANSNPGALAALGYTTPGEQKLAVQDDPSKTPNGRVSPLTGADNPLAASSFMGFFGQFFDHGLDFVKKGADGVVYVPLDAGDPLYAQATQANVPPGFLASRTNTAAVAFGAGGSDQVLQDLLGANGVEGGRSFTAVTGAGALGATAGGNIILNGRLIAIPASNGGAAGDQAILSAINAVTGETGITASLDGAGRLTLTPAAGDSFNTISPFIDLSQSYGSIGDHTVFLREYDANGKATGELVSGNTAGGSVLNGGTSTGVSRWSDIKTNALRIGITLHDYNVNGVPVFRHNADGSTYFDANGKAWLVATDKTTGAVVYVQDTAKDKLAAANLELLTNPQAFLDDIAHAANAALGNNLNAAGDIIDATNAALLNAHVIAGDGRANENQGLTTIHDIFHSEHANNVQQVLSHFQVTSGVAGEAGAVYLKDANGNYVDTQGRAWTGEDIFQAAKGATEMEYQHLVFAEFARKLSPNINAFAGYDITIDPAVTSEFANAVYRFGHSMMTNNIEETLADGTDVSIPLLQGFLDPLNYNADTASNIMRGTTNAVGNMIDEWVTPVLRDNLVGLPLDLATLNLVRGRDTGTAALNVVRADLFAQTGLTSLKPYANWDEFGANLVHPESIVNFIAAYAETVLKTDFANVHATQAEIDAVNNDATLTPEQKTFALNALDLRAKAVAASQDTAFMTAGAGSAAYDAMNSIDLWIGGLAEQKVSGGMLGSTFDFVFANQLIKLQNADRLYYLNRLAGTDMLTTIDSQLFSDLVMRNTNAQHLYADIFSAADDTVDMNKLSADQSKDYGTLAALKAVKIATTDALGNPVTVGTAGFVGNTFYGNAGDYLDARGVLSPNGAGVASETIIGTANADRINALDGNDTVYGDGGNDFIEGGLGNDFLKGGDGDDTITDSDGGDFIWGDLGNDNINAGAGIDQVFGGDGNDIIAGGMGADAIDGMNGNDTIYGDNGPVNGLLDKLGDSDVIFGGNGDDTIYGGGGADTIDGGDGNDTIIGGTGLDVLVGGEGNDVFVMDAAEFGRGNTVDGGTGFDVVDYSLAVGPTPNTGLTIDLGVVGAAIVPPTQTPPDSYLNVEGARGTRFADTMLASQGGNAANPNPIYQNDALGNPVLVNQYGVEVVPNAAGTNGQNVFVKFTFEGGLGNDSITGSNGLDTVSYEHAAGAVTVTLTSPAAGSPAGTPNSGVSTGADGNDTLSSIENIRGGAFADTLTGDGGANEIEGDGGADRINGGAGADTVSYEHRATGVSVNLRTGANSDNDVLTSIENARGSAFADTLTASNAGSVLWGMDGADSLVGGTGNDTLDGGLGADNMQGGAGNDIYVVDNIGDVVTDTGGVDTVRTSLVSFALGANMENLVFTGLAGFSGTGNALANSITGGDAGDILDGGAGADTLVGGAGDDVYLVDVNGAGNGLQDTIVEGANADAVFGAPVTGTDAPSSAIPLAAGFTAATGGVDTIRLRSTVNTTYTLQNNVENLDASLIGAGLTAALTGNAAANVITGHAGVDAINGGAGADTMTGAAGADRFVFSSAADIGNAVNARDIIRDFTSGTDKLDLSAVDGNRNQAGVQGFTYIGASAFSNVAGQLRLDQGVLFGDTNGDGVSDFQIQMDGVTSLTNADFIFATGGGGGGGGGALPPNPGTPGRTFTATLAQPNITGTAGNDTMNGNLRANTITSRAGNDVMTGGGRGDTFVFSNLDVTNNANSSAATSLYTDTITDFSAAQGDIIDLRGIDANSAVAGDQAFTLLGAGQQFTAAGQARLVVNGANSTLELNTTGATGADFAINLTGVTALPGANVRL
jgi:Ca2+-binding RTX toxin-like protein